MIIAFTVSPKRQNSGRAYAESEEEKMKCSECAGRYGPEDIGPSRKVRVKNPDTGKWTWRTVCEEHIECLLQDGYEVEE